MVSGKPNDVIATGVIVGVVCTVLTLRSAKARFKIKVPSSQNAR